MNLLIIGDSFAADWSVKYPDKYGWPNYLAEKYNVTNIAQAGCSEFKIKKQLDSVDLTDYTHCIVSHTSASRIPVERNPLHYQDLLHQNCDFIYADVAESDNSDVQCIKEYYEKFYYDDFYNYVYKLIAADIAAQLNKFKIKSLHMTFFDQSLSFLDSSYYLLFRKFPGTTNHLSSAGNNAVIKNIQNWLDANDTE